MKIDIKNFGSTKKTFTKALKKGSGELINPLRDWTIGLAIATVVFFVGIGFTAFDFYTQLILDSEVIIEDKPLIYKQNEVRFYSELYSEKEKTFNTLRMYKEFALPKIEDDQEISLDKEKSISTDSPGTILDKEMLAE